MHIRIIAVEPKTTSMKLSTQLLLLLLLWKVTSSRTSGPPHIGVEELVLQEGSTLNLTCKGSKVLHWKAKHDLADLEHDVAHTNREGNDGTISYVSTLTVNNLSYLDTGYYYCYYDGAIDFESDKENVDSTYVYVNDPQGNYPFVENYGQTHNVNVQLPHALVINCATTHPDIRVTLHHNSRDITNNNRVSFDPRKGFLIEHLSTTDDGMYTCITDEEIELTVEVKISKAEKIMRQPSIYIGKNQHFVRGDSFFLECTVINQNDELQFNWIYPYSKANYHQEMSSVTRNNITHSKSILIVPEASEADSGNYTCYLSSDKYLNSDNVSLQIEIQESMDSFVNISDSITSRIDVLEGEPAEWKAEMRYYPHDITIEYTDWRKQQLKPSERLTIEHIASEAQSWLKIKNTTSSDFGSYTITVTTSDGKASDSATVQIDVHSIPYMKVEGVPRVVAPKQSLNITCSAVGFPVANVSILFQECTNGSNSCDTQFNTIQSEKDDALVLPPGNIVEKSVVFSPNTSGLLWCLGQNELGNENKTANVVISEINDTFMLHHQGQNTTEVGNHAEFITVVENDDFTLTCGGSKFYYKSVKLTHTSSSSSNSTDDFSPEVRTFSWLTTIQQKVNKTLAGEYTCTAEPHDNEQNDTKKITITVSEEQEVHFAEGSNMTNKTVDVTYSGSVTLNCNVTGAPTPTIQWTKDDEILNRNSEFLDGKANFIDNSKVLKLSFVTPSHVGVYTCTAQNRLNSVTGSLTVTLSVSELGTATKVGLAVAFVFLAFLVFVVGFLSFKAKDNLIPKPGRTPMDFLYREGDIDQLNPKLTTDQQAMLLPYDLKWEIPRSNIKLGKLLGSGEFGRVLKATVIGLEGSSSTTVAVKTCKCEGDHSQVNALVVELKIMIHLGKHLNIVNLMGANTENINKAELWIVVEYCRFGNLLDFMKRHRRRFINQVSPTTGKINSNRITMNSFPPVSPSFQDHLQTPVDQDMYLTPISSKFVLSDPPPGHSTRPVHLTMSLNEPSASGNPYPHGPVRQCVSNPMYSLILPTSSTTSKEGVEGNKDSTVSQLSQHRDSRLLSIGSSTLSDTTSVSCLPENEETNNIAASMESPFTSSPLSPTDSCFIGEGEWDSKRSLRASKGGHVPGVSAPFSTSDLISWGWQVANGMDYLSRRNVLHGDLAARNLLLADNNVVKISDFGMSRDIYKRDIYVKKQDIPMPVKWMSIEAIRERAFSSQSDVWSFGITLWEIFSLGSTPYPDIEINEKFLQLLQNNYRMHCPKYANQEIYNIMMQCWEAEPMARPSFSQLVNHLGMMMPQHLQGEYMSMNDMYMKMNEERFKKETDYLTMMASPDFESLPKPQEVDLDPTNISSPLIMQLPDTVAYIQEDSHSSLPLTASPVGSDYLPMNTCCQGLPSPSSNVFSSIDSEHSRFTFPSFNLASFPEEDEDTAFPEPEGSFENSVFTSLRSQSPSGSKNNGDRTYMNI